MQSAPNFFFPFAEALVGITSVTMSFASITRSYLKKKQISTCNYFISTRYSRQSNSLRSRRLHRSEHAARGRGPQC